MTTNLLRRERPFHDFESDCVAVTLGELRSRLPFLLCAYCLMPDHLHAIVFPHEGTTVSEILRRFKPETFHRLHLSGHRSASFWQSRFYDHILRTRAEFDDTLEYIHANPVRKGLVGEPAAWRWSSAQWFVDETGPIALDVMRLPFDSHARI